MHPEDIPPLTSTLQALAQAPRTVRSFVFRWQHNQGVWRTLEGDGIGRHDSRNEFYVTLTLRDVTEYKRKVEGVKLPEAKIGFVLWPQRWVVERSFAWAARLRCLAGD